VRTPHNACGLNTSPEQLNAHAPTDTKLLGLIWPHCECETVNSNISAPPALYSPSTVRAPAHDGHDSGVMAVTVPAA
jgi:hypothetical protein